MFDYNNLQSIPTIQLRSKSVLVYTKFIGCIRSKAFLDNAEKLKSTKKYTGSLTFGSIKRMSKAIDLLISSTPDRVIINPATKRRQSFRLSFVTLTFPAAIKLTQSAEAKKLLEQMLRFMRVSHNMKSYVWKAEVTKKGQIHFHITSNAYVHYQELRNYWNKLMVKSGLFDDYFKKRGNSDINSTDIHSVRKVRDLAAYLLKYFTKSYQNEVPVKGKVWDCSLNLKSNGYYETELTEPDLWELKDGARKGDLKEVVLDNCIIYKSARKHVFNFIDSRISADYNKYLYNVFEGFSQDSVLIIKEKIVEVKSLIIGSQIYKPVQVSLFN